MNKLLKAIEKFEDRKILVIGDIILDEYVYGEISRINPEASSSHLVKVKEEEYFLGGAANVANNLASLGCGTYLFGVIGEGLCAGKIDELCNKAKINLESIAGYDGRPTVLKKRVMVDNHQIIRMDYEKTNEINRVLENMILDDFKKYIGEADCIAISDYDKGTLTKNLSQKIIKMANKNKVPVLIDPKPQNVNYFKNSNVIRLNHHEASIITNIDYKNGNNLIKTAKKLQKITNSQYTIISCGKDGLFVYDGNKNKKIGTNAKELADVTGAGDTVLAGLCLGLTSGLNIYEASELANYMAGIVVGKVGTAIVTKKELIQAIKKDYK